MEVVDLSDEPPAPRSVTIDPIMTKKRRFFTEDSPEKLVNQEDAPATSSPLRDDTETIVTNGSASVIPAFDANLLESLVGEKLEKDVLQRLQELSGDNIERGRMGHLRKGNFD
jgi:hypothetical protein